MVAKVQSFNCACMKEKQSKELSKRVGFSLNFQSVNLPQRTIKLPERTVQLP